MRFGSLVGYGLQRRRLAVKFLFAPGSVAFWPDPAISSAYPMWLREIAEQTVENAACLRITGHTSTSGAAAYNDRISLARAKRIEADLVAPRLSVTESGLLTTVDWAELGEQSHEAPGVSSGVGSAVISPRFMLNAVQVLDPGDVTVTIPDDEERAIRIRQSELSVYIMPRSESDMTRSAVEEVLEECFGPDVLRPDADGDYGLSIYGVPVYARLIEGQPSSLKVFAQVVTEIDSSAELLEELNALNAAYDFVKVVLHGAVLAVEGDLVADTLDAPELTTLYDRIRYVANELGPALTAMYGGIGVERGDTTRWSTYTRTAVLTELRPGQIVDLSGPNAVEEWPFPGEIHVITAWNPFGRFRTVEQNDEQNALLAADVVRAGGTALRAEGRSLDVDYGEPSLLVWGLDTATVIEIAAAYDQEAVFRIDADQLEVLGVFQEQRAARPRLTARSDASHDDSNG